MRLEAALGPEVSYYRNVDFVGGHMSVCVCGGDFFFKKNLIKNFLNNKNM